MPRAPTTSHGFVDRPTTKFPLILTNCPGPITPAPSDALPIRHIRRLLELSSEKNDRSSNFYASFSFLFWFEESKQMMNDGWYNWMRVVVLRDLMDRFFFCARGKMYLLKYSKRLLVNHSNKHRISSNRILHNFSLAITSRSSLALSKFSLKLSLRGYIYRVFYNNQS